MPPTSPLAPPPRQHSHHHRTRYAGKRASALRPALIVDNGWVDANDRQRGCWQNVLAKIMEGSKPWEVGGRGMENSGWGSWGVVARLWEGQLVVGPLVVLILLSHISE